ncbi:MAG: carbonic anhydrase [Bacteroidetes bacterium]|nr:MAG: carbonic anhydrase [Bacteroidota bacterium]
MENTGELSKQVKTKENLDLITPTMALQMLKEGNQRFLSKDMIEREHDWHIRETIDSQHPFAIVLGCIDSRVEPSILFDQGIGDLFIARIAGNIINQDILGSMEYACAVSGSKLIMVLGHTSCGAIKGAIDGVILDNLTPSLKHMQLAMAKVETDEGYDRSTKNLDFVNSVAHKNVELSIEDIKNHSPILRTMYEKGEIDIAGSIYDHSTGAVRFC